MPGLINIHAHMATEPVNKGFRDEVRSPSFWHSPLYEHLYMIEVGAKEALTTVQVAVGELLLSGVTTGVHLGQLQLGVDSGALYDMLARPGCGSIWVRCFVTHDGRHATGMLSNTCGMLTPVGATLRRPSSR